MTEEQKEKYANFLNKVSEILGLNRPVDILRLCAVTDEYFRPIEKRIAELEKENAELKEKLGDAQMQKAGKTKWHKVADGDLPSEEGGWVCNQNGLPCFFDWGTEQWLDCEGTQIRTTEWCHMPHKE